MCKDPGKEGEPGAFGKRNHLAGTEVGVCMLWGSSEQLVEGRLLKKDETRDGSRSQNLKLFLRPSSRGK